MIYSANQISSDELETGDILLMVYKDTFICRHVGVVSETVPEIQRLFMYHMRGVGYPYALTEMPIPSKEMLEEKGLQILVYRLNNSHYAKMAVTNLDNWRDWAVPFDHDRLKKAEAYNNQAFGIQTDITNDNYGNITIDDLAPKLEENYQKLKQEFSDHIMDVVKYASRRDTSPVRPKSEGEHQTGFHCLQAIMVAFQVAFVQNYIKSVPNKWLSNKNKDLFASPSEAIINDVEMNTLIQAIPPAFQLRAKVCSLDTFRYALESDATHISTLGVLSSQPQEVLNDFTERDKKNVTFYYDMGIEERKSLADSLDKSLLKSKKLK